MNKTSKTTKTQPKTETRKAFVISMTDNMGAQEAPQATETAPKELETPTPIENIKEEKEAQIEAPKALKRFAKIMKEVGHKSVTNEETGRAIWDCWLEYSGRTDRFRGCSTCLANKIVKMKKECDKYGINYK